MRIFTPTRGGLTALAACAALLLSGCGAEPSPSVDEPVAASPDEPPAETEAETETEAEPEEVDEPRTQEKSCDWDSPALSTSSFSPPTGTDGDLESVLIGAWQHVAFDAGGGYESVSKDIRYVFPSTSEMLYCQHVPGVTDHAEAEAVLTIDGLELALPNPSPGYAAEAWSDDTLVLLNHMDQSRYLLIRR